jgi:hypothetical protein
MMMAVKIMTSKRVFRSGGRGCRSRRHRTRGRVLLAKYRRRRRHVRLLRVSLRARVRKRRVYFMRAFGGIDYSSILSSFWLLLLPLYNLLLRYATTKYLPLFRVGGGCSLRRRDSLCLFLSLSSFGIQPTMLLFLPLARTSSYLLNASLLFPHVSFQVRKHSCQTRAPSRECAETRERSRTYKSTPISSSPTIWVLDKPKSITYMESVCA